MDWSDDDEKLVNGAVKVATKNFKSKPRGYDREDLLQEGRLAWWQAMETHDPAKGAKSTLIFTVVRRKIYDLIRAGNTDKRRIHQHTVPFSEEFEDGE